MNIFPWRRAAEPTASETPTVLAEDTPKRAPINSEVGLVNQGSSIYGFLSEHFANPDAVVKRKGWAYLRGMEDGNGYVYGLTRTRITSIKRRGWYVTPASDEPRDIEIADFVTWAIDEMPGAFTDDLGAVCEAIKYGYAVLEKNWTIAKTGEYSGRVVPSRLAPKQQEHYRVRLDDFGNITEIQQKTRNGLQWEPVPLDKFIWTTFEGEPGNPYGHGLYSRLFWHDWFLREGWKFWAVHTERYASPHVKVKTTEANISDSTKDEARRIIRMIRNDTGFIEPNGWEVSYLEAMRAGGAEYERFAEEQRNAIATVVLGQTLSSSQGDVGSQALGRVHKEVQNEITDDDTTWLFTVLNEQFVRQLVAYNYATDRVPIIGPEPRNDRDVSVWSTVLANLSKAGLAIPTRWVYDEFGIDPPEGDEPTLKRLLPSIPSYTRDTDTDDEEEELHADHEHVHGEHIHGEHVRLADSYPETVDDTPFWREPTKFENKRLLEKLHKEIKSLEDRASADALPMFVASRDAMIAQVERAGIFDIADTDKRLAAMRGLNISPKLREYEELVRRAYLTAEFIALDEAASELREQGSGLPTKFAVGDDIEDIMAPDALYNAYESREVVTKAQFRRMDQAARGYAWYVSTQDGERTVQIVRNALLESISNNWSMRQFEVAVKRGYEDMQYVGKALGTGTEKATTARIRTIYRNAIMDATNKTRARLFQAAESIPNDPVVAYQISAVMDDRTSDICAAIDGKIMRAGSETMPMPPYHHNCRTIWVPINETRAAAMDDKDLIDSRPVTDGKVWEPQKGFGRS